MMVIIEANLLKTAMNFLAEDFDETSTISVESSVE